jgi:hypothetical protein
MPLRKEGQGSALDPLEAVSPDLHDLGARDKEGGNEAVTTAESPPSLSLA